MASSEQVKKYLAYWFQLGKAVSIHGDRELIRPKSVIQADRYSGEFDACWNKIYLNSGDCHLEGTEQSIADLLTSQWEITDCARCEMPIPIRPIGLTPLACPCHDLPSWPDFETPAPRSPVSSPAHLGKIHDRLQRLSTWAEFSPRFHRHSKCLHSARLASTVAEQLPHRATLDSC